MQIKLSAEFWCDETVDQQSEDEIYVNVAAVSSEGEKRAFRAPGPGQHWSMNDDHDNNAHHYGPFVLGEFQLSPNQGWEFGFAVMQEDGGTSADWGSTVGAGLAFGGTTLAIPALGVAAAVVSGLGNLLGIEDSDEVVGSVALRVLMNENSELQTYWAILNADSAEMQEGNLAYVTRMKGAGGNYKITFRVGPA